MAKRRRKGGSDSELLRTVTALEEEIEQLELLARRAGKVELDSGKAMLRAGQLLGDAVEAHGRFATQLQKLTKSIGEIQARQNEAVQKLQHTSTCLQERQSEYARLEQRFRHIGNTAEQANESLRSGEDGDTDTRARIRAVIDQLDHAAQEAGDLAAEAKAAEFDELERQITAARQQLQSLAGKLRQATD